MTIEDREAPARCRNCGAWLPQTALECPGCGSPREMQMSGIAGRPIPPRWLVIGGGLAVVIGAIVWVLAQTPAPGPVAEESPTATPSAQVTPSETPSPVVTPTASPSPDRTPFLPPIPEPTPEPTPLPSRPPLILTTGFADLGSHGEVAAATLRVRNWPGLDSTILTELEAGTEMLIRDGPVAADGFDWYSVVFPALPYTDYGELAQGWVAVGPTGGKPSLVHIDSLRCPTVTISATLLGATGGMARRMCLPGSHEFTAVVETCYEGPITPYDYEPQWLWFSCLSLFDLGSNVQLDIRLPPSVAPPDGLARGSVVHVVGHFDDPAAQSCTVVTEPDTGAPAPSEVDQAVFRLECASHFVLEQIEIVDQIDLPPLF